MLRRARASATSASSPTCALVLGPGMTALTGETGAGKTMLVEAIELLVGGRADAVLVRPGAAEARVEGRFVDRRRRRSCCARVVPADGRSPGLRRRPAGHRGRAGRAGRRAGRPARPARPPVAARRGRAARRARPLRRRRPRRRCARPGPRLRRHRRRAGRARRRRAGPGPRDRPAALPGRRARRAPASTTPTRTTRLDAEEDVLADAAAHREAARGAVRRAGRRRRRGRRASAPRSAAVAGRRAVRRPSRRGCAPSPPSSADVAAELRGRGRGASTRTPSGSPRVRARRQLLRDLRRKYGDTLAEVIAFAGEAARPAAPSWRRYDERAAALDAERRDAVAARGRAPRPPSVAARRDGRAAAGRGGRGPPARAGHAAGPLSRSTVGGDDPGDDVAFLLAANPGEPPLPLAKVASGGELARAMLALRLVLTDGARRTLVFDEVDAGIGGEAALAVGPGARRPRRATTRCWSSPTCPRWRRSPTHQVAVDQGRSAAAAPSPRRTPLDDGGPGRRAVADAVGPARERDGARATPRSCWPRPRASGAR